MYTAFWNFTCRPFENHIQPPFYYPSEVHQAALLKLRYAIENQRGAALLTGGSGLGKTLLIGALGEQLPERLGPIVHIKFPQMSPAELLLYLAEKMGATSSAETGIERSIRRIEETLERNAQDGRHTIVVIDEAHLLCGSQTLETVRLLLNLVGGWTLILAGQPALLPALERFPQLDERLGVKCLLRPFTIEETIGYVSHRLRAAGGASTVFELEALETIHQLSEGVPRRINRLCDLALLIGFAEERDTISSSHIRAVAEELVAGNSLLRKAA